MSSTRFPLLVLATLAPLAGCPKGADFIECRDDTSCDLAEGGRCLVNPPTGHQFCAYPADDCPGGMRWSDLDVEDSISGMCVAETPPDAGVDAPIDAMPDAWPDGGPGCQLRITFASNRDGDYEVYVINADSTGLIALTDNDDDDRDPQWSPDGTLIAFTSDRDGNVEIYTMLPNGSSETRTTNNGAEDKWPRWAPDSSRIAFVRAGNVWLINPNGTGENQITTSGDVVGPPVWSPNGATIAMTRSLAGNLEVGAVTVATETLVNLTNNAAIDAQPSWSPTGDRIAFRSQRTGDSEIYVMNANGANPVELTTNAASDSLPYWSPAGGVIAFASARDGNDEVYTMNEDGSNQLNRSLFAGRSDLPAGWAPDGSLLAFIGANSVRVMPPDGAFQINVSNASGSTDEFGSFSPVCP